MNNPIAVLLLAQVLFSIGDLLARYKMSRFGFHKANLLSLWFSFYIVSHFAATMMQLYVFSTVELGRVITLLAVSGIVFSNVAGLLFLHEVLTVYSYAGVVLAIVAFIFLALNR